ncbi:MAG: sigma-54-dependent Fis family transcriptional regulator [Planctomycetales bacterium]|nr:sigma-54-dependent Fis family transcriptional regulator [Planctomycetales bacterium]
MAKILVIDDDRSVRHLITRALDGQHGFEVITAGDGDAGLQLLEDHRPRVVLLDIFLPQYNGLELFRKIRAMDHKLPVIFITGDTSSETAIEAMRAGAFDYLAKPLNIEQLRKLTLSAAQARKLMDEPVALPVGEGDTGGERFVGKAKTMIEVYKDIGRVASQNVTVLIRGESGSGKELVARALVHHSQRRGQPFVAVNCAAIPDQLLESELFGHEKGAFTGAERRRIGRFEQCDGGTIFLDEIGDMSPIIQGKVLRLLQEQKFERVGGNELITTDVRIIAATNRPLEQMVESEDFREDLLYRLNGFTIPLPPLRDRREDIPLLLEYFLRRAKSEMNRPQLSGISPNALELLVAYNWPGNIRQLQSVVRQALLNTTGTVIDADNLPSFVRVASGEPPANLPENFVGASGGAAGSSADSPSGMPARREYAAPPNRSALAAAATASPAGGQAPGASNSEIPSSDVVQVEFSLSQFIAERLAAGSADLYAETLEQVERRLFTRILEATAGNQSKSAEILGITRGKVRDRIAAFEIHLDRTISVGK